MSASPQGGSVNAAFHAWLRTQFTSLDEAKSWVWRWRTEWDQEIPASVSAEWAKGAFSMRAMAAHVSEALEGKEYEWDGWTLYLDTKYGSELYFAMSGPRPSVRGSDERSEEAS